MKFPASSLAKFNQHGSRFTKYEADYRGSGARFRTASEHLTPHAFTKGVAIQYTAKKRGII
jgi:hypothetical protein